MNRKGFTLVELLAVILVLAGISIIAVAGISAALDRNDKGLCEKETEIVINAAKVYFSLNNGSSSVSVRTLINGNYISNSVEFSKLDPDNTNVSWNESQKKYVVYGSGAC